MASKRHEIPDLKLVRDIVASAAKAELTPHLQGVERARKPDGSVVTAADLAMQRRICGALIERWPQYRVLGEEMQAAEQVALLAEPELGLWCLDPLDGSSNFAAGIPFFSISLALLVAGRPLLGLVYDPLRGECFTAVQGRGAWLNGRPLRADLGSLHLSQCIAIVDFKRLSPAAAARLAKAPPYASQRSFGSVALDWCWVAAGRAHVYLHGAQRLWDYAAGTLILQEAGGHAVTLQGEPVFQARLEPRSAVAALDRQLFDEWTDWLGSA